VEGQWYKGIKPGWVMRPEHTQLYSDEKGPSVETTQCPSDFVGVSFGIVTKRFDAMQGY
jgi:hypothetical protein